MNIFESYDDNINKNNLIKYLKYKSICAIQGNYNKIQCLKKKKNKTICEYL